MMNYEKVKYNVYAKIQAKPSKITQFTINSQVYNLIS